MTRYDLKAYFVLSLNPLIVYTIQDNFSVYTSTDIHEMLYFAYGSNMVSERLKTRIPSPPQTIVKAILPEYDLRFHKKSTDGSGKCTVVENEGDVVHGIIFEIDEAGKRELDEIEGVGSGYEIERISVQSGKQWLHPYTYVASHEYIDEAVIPYSWYKTLVLEGAKEHKLPRHYISEIQNVNSHTDVDRNRAMRNLAVLG